MIYLLYVVKFKERTAEKNSTNGLKNLPKKYKYRYQYQKYAKYTQQRGELWGNLKKYYLFVECFCVVEKAV